MDPVSRQYMCTKAPAAVQAGISDTALLSDVAVSNTALSGTILLDTAVLETVSAGAVSTCKACFRSRYCWLL